MMSVITAHEWYREHRGYRESLRRGAVGLRDVEADAAEADAAEKVYE
jgi:hypothetical protein